MFTMLSIKWLDTRTFPVIQDGFYIAQTTHIDTVYVNQEEHYKIEPQIDLTPGMWRAIFSADKTVRFEYVGPLPPVDAHSLYRTAGLIDQTLAPHLLYGTARLFDGDGSERDE